MTIEDIAIQFIATLFGVLVGIPAALGINRIITKGHEKERAIFVLTALREELIHNLGLLKQIINELTAPTTMIYYNMDMNTWRTVKLEDFEGIINHEILRRIFGIYYEYEHLNRKIDTQFSMHYSVVRAMPTYEEERRKIIGSIRIHIVDTLERDTQQLVNDIKTEIDRLTNPMRYPSAPSIPSSTT
jgi:hypothetical protein